jgi:hypothetical protein
MRLIPLTQGKFVQVDDWNYNRLMEYKWYANKIRGSFYAKRNVVLPSGKRTSLFMHREIMNTPDNMQCDHINHDTLNCLEENMRNCTHHQNLLNRLSRGKSSYIGVSSYYKTGTKGQRYLYFTSYITINRITINLGNFKDEIKAAKTRDEAAIKYFGKFANLNFKGDAPAIN